jgi:hypothetical protein
VKPVFLPAVLFSICATHAFAAAPDVTYSADRSKVMVNGAGTTKPAPAPAATAASLTIYSNLATLYKKGTYFSGTGNTLCGTACLSGYAYAATAFTPKANATAGKVVAAIGGIVGTEFSIGIYSDANGIPGAALWTGSVKNVPTFGTCCDLARAEIAGGLALKGGTQYWFVAIDRKTADSTFQGAWALAEVDQIDSVPYAGDLGAGWRASTTTQPPAFGVYK